MEMDEYERSTAATLLLPRASKLALTYLRRYSGVLDPTDLISVAGYAVAIALQRYDPTRGPIEPLVDAIVRRQVMSEIRRALERRRFEDHFVRLDTATFDDDESVSFEHFRPAVDPVGAENVEQHLETLERHAAIVRGLSKVADEDLGLIRARNQGKTYRAIGAAVGVRGQSVHERVAKARRTIHAELAAVE